MNGKVFVDTNVFVYAYDRSEPEKQKRAFEVLDWLTLNDRGALSTQVLSEMYVTLTGKISAPLSHQEAGDRLKNYHQSWLVLDITALIVLEAARGVQDHQLNYWNSLIWATAKLNQIEVILSEDFNAGSVTEGVRFDNPFSAHFVVKDLLE